MVLSTPLFSPHLTHTPMCPSYVCRNIRRKREKKPHKRTVLFFQLTDKCGFIFFFLLLRASSIFYDLVDLLPLSLNQQLQYNNKYNIHLQPLCHPKKRNVRKCIFSILSALLLNSFIFPLLFHPIPQHLFNNEVAFIVFFEWTRPSSGHQSQPMLQLPGSNGFFTLRMISKRVLPSVLPKIWSVLLCLSQTMWLIVDSDERN